jgi:hypothetical protein
MCQPAPLGRCSTDSRSAYETAELKLNDESRKEREYRFQTNQAHKFLETTAKETPENSRFGSTEDRKLKQAKRDFERNAVLWETAKERKAAAVDDLAIKRMHFDTSPAGHKELMENPDAEDREARLELAYEVSTWQSGVKDLTDDNGNPITSKEGRQTPEARAAFVRLFKEAQREHAFYVDASKRANEHAEAMKKRSRDYETSYGHLVEKQDEIAYQAAVTARKQELRTLMLRDRMDDLKKVLQKTYSRRVA